MLAATTFDYAYAVAAFPGAQGGGATSVGGRSGSVLMVTNLNDSGAGSLRACVDASGARTCIFRVSGTISLSSPLVINNGSITIAGQSAPGGGIQISGKSMNKSTADSALIKIYASDVVIRYLRLRVGSGAWTSEAGRATGYRTGKRVILDHLSAYWSPDDIIEQWDQYTGSIPITHYTVSWSIIAESFDGGGHGSILGGNNSDSGITMVNHDYHHNYFVSNPARNPTVGIGQQVLANNIVYNWGIEEGTGMRGGNYVDIVNSIYRGGPSSDTGSNPDDIIYYNCPGWSSCIDTRNPQIYVSGNIFHPNGSATNPASDNWPHVRGWDGVYFTLPGGYQRFSPLAAETNPIVLDTAASLPTSMLPTVGASQRLDCSGNLVNVRDAADTRVVGYYSTNGGSMITSETQVGGFPTIATGATPCPDADLDGMPDTWENGMGLNPNLANDRNFDADGDGFTNLEEYLGGLSPLSVCLLGYPPPTAAPTGYATAWSQVSGSQEVLLTGSCAGGTTINVVAGSAGSYVYKTGYRYDGAAWQSYTLTGSNPLGANWFLNTATASIPKLPAQTSYFVVYACQVSSGAWKCGCSDATCATPKWLMQSID
jgi:pectate lyase